MDVISFLALGGLFTAHITGNLVIERITLRISLAQIGPLFSVPMFVGVLGLVTVAFTFCEMSVFKRLRKVHEEKTDS